MNYLEIAKKYRAKRNLGQNFLVDERILDFIVDASNLSTEDIVVEIGAGLGFLTDKLAPKVKKLIAVELDSKAIEHLKKLNHQNIEILAQDILITNFKDITDTKVKVIANLPYYITTPILLHLLGEIDQLDYENRNLISEMVIMVQKEVGQRIQASTKSKHKQWGALSILVQYWSDVEILKEIPPQSFWPKPKVDSVILKLTPRDKPLVDVKSPRVLRNLAKGIFNFRRKNIKNALAASGFPLNMLLEALKECDIAETTRGETLTMEELALLANNIYDLQEKVELCQS